MKPNIVGIGTRVLNFLVDIIFILLLSILFFKIHKWYVFYYKINYFNFGWFFFGTMFIYYFILETIFAKTPGKWLTQTKVVNLNGSKPSITSIAIRSLFRITIIDIFFIPFIDKTLHDYVSKTIVVEV
jgi:uncharacterized RDD family membrane protein YckC